MGLGPEELEALYRGGIIHDIGKIGIPDSILLKPGELDSEERVRMNLHPIIGENIVAPLRSSADLRPMIRHHNERYDATGYPDRLSNEQIPLLPRPRSVPAADNALLTDRPYHGHLAPRSAQATL